MYSKSLKQKDAGLAGRISAWTKPKPPDARLENDGRAVVHLAVSLPSAAARRVSGQVGRRSAAPDARRKTNPVVTGGSDIGRSLSPTGNPARQFAQPFPLDPCDQGKFRHPLVVEEIALFDRTGRRPVDVARPDILALGHPGKDLATLEIGCRARPLRMMSQRTEGQGRKMAASSFDKPSP